MLEELVKTHSDLSEYHRIPPLGQHYTQRWAKEDLENERVKGSAQASGADGADKQLDELSGSTKLLRKVAESVANNEESAPYGELTQRLVGGKEFNACY